MYDPPAPKSSSHHHRHKTNRRDPPPMHRRRHWCCSFTTPPLSPETQSQSSSFYNNNNSKKTEIPSPPHKPTPLARRILSPGRVSPISDPQPPPPLSTTVPQVSSPPPKSPSPAGYFGTRAAQGEANLGVFDVRLNLKSKTGGSVVLELGSEVLIANSSVFADLISDYRRKNLDGGGGGGGLCRIEVPDVENLGVFRETIELMFVEDVHNRLLKTGVFRAIHILEVSAGIKFDRGVSSCLKYLEAVPWSEEEEEKLRELLTKINIDGPTTTDILERLTSHNSATSQRTLVKQLIWSITTSTDANARNELKSLVKGLLCKSSVYEKNCPDLNKEDIFAVCKSCLNSLVTLLEEATTTYTDKRSTRKEKDNNKPLLERISKQVDNINWLLDILLDHQMAEEFVDLWADQRELIRMHENVSPMVRYELSRVSATLFLAIGTKKLQCRSETRLNLAQVWFRPMLSDFGWLQRCKKGLDVKALEEAMGQALLTLPLKEQYALFMDWFRCFSQNGTECPNLSKAFQIWWRRSFLRGSETSAIESR